MTGSCNDRLHRKRRRIKEKDDAPTLLPFARFRLPSGRVLATVPKSCFADWDTAFRHISEWIGPRGAFHLAKSDGSLLRVGTYYSAEDYAEFADTDTLDEDEYGVIMQPDAGRGFELVILDEDGNRTSRLAQRLQTGGFEYNSPAYLRSYLALRDAPERERWGSTWPAWVLMPYQCEHCKLVTTVLGANLLEWPVDFDCCPACSGRDFFNCARCERIIDESDGDTNWCAQCSMWHSPGGTFLRAGPPTL